MSDFDERMKAAIERGQRRNLSEKEQLEQQKAQAEQLRRTHTQLRVELSEHIESVLQKMSDHLPGFRYENVFGDAGMGAACWRENLVMNRGQRSTQYSRFEMVIRPFNEFFVVDLHAKGTIANREVFTRNHFQLISDAKTKDFNDLIDQWALSFLELYYAKA